MERLAAQFKTNTPAPRIALLVGATGHVGKALLSELLACDAFDIVRVLARRTVHLASPKATVVLVPDFAMLSAHAAAFANVQFVFCALGSTRAKAGSAVRACRV